MGFKGTVDLANKDPQLLDGYVRNLEAATGSAFDQKTKDAIKKEIGQVPEPAVKRFNDQFAQEDTNIADHLESVREGSQWLGSMPSNPILLKAGQLTQSFMSASRESDFHFSYHDNGEIKHGTRNENVDQHFINTFDIIHKAQPNPITTTALKSAVDFNTSWFVVSSGYEIAEQDKPANEPINVKPGDTTASAPKTKAPTAASSPAGKKKNGAHAHLSNPRDDEALNDAADGELLFSTGFSKPSAAEEKAFDAYIDKKFADIEKASHATEASKADVSVKFKAETDGTGPKDPQAFQKINAPLAQKRLSVVESRVALAAQRHHINLKIIDASTTVNPLGKSDYKEREASVSFVDTSTPTAPTTQVVAPPPEAKKPTVAVQPSMPDTDAEMDQLKKTGSWGKKGDVQISVDKNNPNHYIVFYPHRGTEDHYIPSRGTGNVDETLVRRVIGDWKGPGTRDERIEQIQTDLDSYGRVPGAALPPPATPALAQKHVADALSKLNEDGGTWVSPDKSIQIKNVSGSYQVQTTVHTPEQKVGLLGKMFGKAHAGASDSESVHITDLGEVTTIVNNVYGSQAANKPASNATTGIEISPQPPSVLDKGTPSQNTTAVPSATSTVALSVDQRADAAFGQYMQDHTKDVTLNAGDKKFVIGYATENLHQIKVYGPGNDFQSFSGNDQDVKTMMKADINGTLGQLKVGSPGNVTDLASTSSSPSTTPASTTQDVAMATLPKAQQMPVANKPVLGMSLRMPA